AALLDDAAARERLTAGIYLPPHDELGLGRLEAALAEATEALRVEARLRAAVRRGALPRLPGDELARAGGAAGVIAAADLESLAAAERARAEVIEVDAFSPEEYARLDR